MTGAATLSRRVLNRTLLQRQRLAGRVSDPALSVLRHLVAMQAQHPNGPYVGLWARVAGFERTELTSLIVDHRVVRSTMLRRTQHLAAGEDYLWLRPSVSAIVLSALKDPYLAGDLAGVDLDELAKVCRNLLRGRALSRRALGALLAERYPGRNTGRLAGAVELAVPLVHPPPTSTWGSWGHPTETVVTLAESWIGQPMVAAQLETLVLRYLAAFGPASVPDIQAWAGLTRLRAVVDGLRSRLRVFRDEAGAELVDLPDAPLAAEDLAVPVRFLPAFDNALLGHRDRTRVISDEDRRRTAKVASAGVPMFLVDGFVHGTWSIQDTTMRVQPYRPLSTADTAAVLAEAGRMLAWTTDDAGPGEVVITAVPPG